GEAPSWLRGLRDPALARVLAVLHERPAEPWTVESLAHEVHSSRATLARRFAEVVGEPPLTYLARWRMHLAAQRLKYSTDTVEAIARQVGYTSEYAFNRAFARHRGQPPAATGGSRAPREAKGRRTGVGQHVTRSERCAAGATSCRATYGT